MSKISIANNALMRIGVTRFIESLNDVQIEAQVINRVYDSVRKATLRRLPWSFAKQITKLALTKYAQKPWRFVYRYPSNALRIMRLTDKGEYGFVDDQEQSQQQLVGGQEWVVPAMPFGLSSTVISYETMNIEGQQVVCTNQPLACAEIIADITDTELFDPLFEDLLTWELAKAICTPLAVSQALAEYANAQAQVLYDQARTASLDESYESVREIPDTIKVRL